MMRVLSDSKGFTMVEALVAFGLSIMVIASLLATFSGVKSINALVKHRIQTLQIVRGQIELLKVGGFSAIVNSTSTVSYDAGVDGLFNTADDLRGTLTVTVRDYMDMDNDSNTTETAIDVNGGGNDPGAAAPVRVSFTWTQNIVGQSRNSTVFVDTLLAA